MYRVKNTDCGGLSMNRVGIITGAGSGLGQATAVRLAKEGVNTFLLSIQGVRLQNRTAVFLM